MFFFNMKHRSSVSNFDFEFLYTKSYLLDTKRIRVVDIDRHGYDHQQLIFL